MDDIGASKGAIIHSGGESFAVDGDPHLLPHPLGIGGEPASVMRLRQAHPQEGNPSGAWMRLSGVSG
jgi:hypothetical protein